MLVSCRCLYSMLITTFASIMVVLSVNAQLPVVRKCSNLAGAHLQTLGAVYGLLENRISALDAASRQTYWSKKFLAKHEAQPHSAPFVVSIQMLVPNQGFVHYCAGTIINEHWILTAAHCFSSQQTVANSVIVAGRHDIHDDSEAPNVQVRHIDYYVRHELYLGGINPYDIALIYTRTPLTFNRYVQAAVLPEQDTMPEGYGTLYGWGNVSMTAIPNYPHRLQEAHMPILDNDLCEGILTQRGLPLHETNLCTGPLSGGVSICTADSGGPLIQKCCDYYDQSNIVIGIVSWGRMPCGQKNSPSVFVRVSAFTNWIHQTIGTATYIS